MMPPLILLPAVSSGLEVVAALIAAAVERERAVTAACSAEERFAVLFKDFSPSCAGLEATG